EVNFYRLVSGSSKATNTYGTAKYKGIRGNSITIIIAANVDVPADFDVITVFEGIEIETQTVSDATALVDNDYVVWNTEATLAATAGLAMTSGINGIPVTGTEYQAALNAFEAYSFNVLGCLSTDDTIKDTFIAYTKRLRDENGVKFQTVLHNRETADYEGVVSVENTVTDSGALASSLVYWASGANAGVKVNESITNKLYDGEFTPLVIYTQATLEVAIAAGKFIFHSVGQEVRVLRDINTLTTYTEEKTADFANNQTIRVVDQIANDIAFLFNTKYLGLKPNDNSSRISLWNELVTHHRELETMGAIEGFSADNITVTKGDDKNAVVVTDYITPTNAMEQLYMTVVVQ
ncbi:MAG: phage tail sheath family protein, partial [Clostridiales bacterium]|nr:phage tail sheath family protein [Clostridiales bacterium]